MKYSSKQYAAALYELLEEAKLPAARKEVFSKFAAKLQQNGDVKIVNDIAYHFEKYRQGKEKIIPVSIQTAGKSHPDFPKHLGDKKVELTVTENPNLIAGTIITVGDYRVDNSVRRRLEELASVIQ